MKSNYEYKIKGNYLLIIDNLINQEGNILSVTNNIEQVLEEISKNEELELEDYVIFYRDTMFNWDEVIIKSIRDGKVRHVDFNTSLEDHDFFEKLYRDEN